MEYLYTRQKKKHILKSRINEKFKRHYAFKKQRTKFKK
jgi:hypothetical protein